MKPLAVHALIAMTLLSAATVRAGARVYLLGRDSYVSPTDISANGRVVIGGREADDNGLEPFRWSRGLGMRRIRVPADLYNTASAVSANGAVIAGVIDGDGPMDRAFRWTRRTGAVELNTNSQLSLVPFGISGDGRVIVGTYSTLAEPNVELPFRWTTEAGFQALNTIGSTGSVAIVSDSTHDGGVLVGGSATNLDRIYHACRWTTGLDPELLDGPEDPQSSAAAITPDGSVIVGYTLASPHTSRICRWTTTDGRAVLDTNTTFISSFSQDVSDDGRRVLGTAMISPTEQAAVLWTPEDGLKTLDERYPNVLPAGWRFENASAMSANGRWIVGIAKGSPRGATSYVLDTGRVRNRR